MKQTIFKVALGAALLATLAACNVGDDTDDRENNHASGMRLYTDYGTGCQYLRGGGGGITPRMDANGKQVCRAAGEKRGAP
jgi:hypothetical protein